MQHRQASGLRCEDIDHAAVCARAAVYQCERQGMLLLCEQHADRCAKCERLDGEAIAPTRPCVHCQHVVVIEGDGSFRCVDAQGKTIHCSCFCAGARLRGTEAALRAALATANARLSAALASLRLRQAACDGCARGGSYKPRGDDGEVIHTSMRPGLICPLTAAEHELLCAVAK